MDRRHIYILPTRAGLLYALLIFAMLIGSINYALSLGFFLTFWLAGLGIAAMLHTWRGLAQLEITAGKSSPVFAGQTAMIGVLLNNAQNRPRYAIGYHFTQNPPQFCDIESRAQTAVDISIIAQQRGWFRPGRITFFTEYPLGLFHAWGYAELNCQCLVYPQPALSGDHMNITSEDSTHSGTLTPNGNEDFSGVRNYQKGDSPYRIDWKSSARSMSLYSKTFEGTTQSQLWLNWDDTLGQDIDARISLLTRWVLNANSTGGNWGLNLPGKEISPSSGDTHLHHCLEALALFK